jgi:hypothetical protein
MVKLMHIKNKKSLAAVIIITLIASMVVAFKLTVPTYDIFSGGIDIWATSGTPSSIQTAVNQAASAGGGTVHIPAGDFTFNPPAGGVGVMVPAGVNLVGAGKGKTILRETVERAESTMMIVDGTSIPYNTPNLHDVQKPVKIQGISFIGFVPSRADADSTTNTFGVGIGSIKDFLVYDCEFSNFVNAGLVVDNNMGWETSAYIMRGVISHCSFDQPYKDDLTIDNRIWGYGIIAAGTGWYPGTKPAKQLLGKYDGESNVVYIEDCDFRRCRHAIASNGGGYYVARYNYFTEMILPHYGSYVDVHGTATGMEVYNNIIDNSPVDYRSGLTQNYWGQYLGMGIGIRGGGGVIFGNTIKRCATDIQLYSDLPNDPDQQVKNVWVWNNVNENGSPANVVAWDSEILNSEYFLRAPTLSQDGFTYTPYPYPHPLTTGVLPPTPTPTPISSPTPVPSTSPTPLPSESPTPTLAPPPPPESTGNWFIDAWNSFIYWLRWQIFGWWR